MLSEKTKKYQNRMFFENPWLLCSHCKKKIKKNETIIEIKSVRTEDFGDVEVMHKTCFHKIYGETPKNY